MTHHNVECQFQNNILNIAKHIYFILFKTVETLSVILQDFMNKILKVNDLTTYRRIQIGNCLLLSLCFGSHNNPTTASELERYYRSKYPGSKKYDLYRQNSLSDSIRKSSPIDTGVQVNRCGRKSPSADRCYEDKAVHTEVSLCYNVLLSLV